MLALEPQRGDARAVDEDVEDPVALAAPVGRAQDERLVADGGVELEEAAGSGVAARPEAVGDGIGNRAGEAVPALVVLDAEPDDVDRARVQRRSARVLGSPRPRAPPAIRPACSA